MDIKKWRDMDINERILFTKLTVIYFLIGGGLVVLLVELLSFIVHPFIK